MEEGATIRQRQEIIKLPDLSRMLVEVKVHESQVSQVRRGQPAGPGCVERVLGRPLKGLTMQVIGFRLDNRSPRPMAILHWSNR
jgi:hypothetical protein